MTSMRFAAFSLFFLYLAPSVCASARRTTQSEPQRTGVEALGAIVGTWQSDVVQGRSARSSCVWTPEHTAVLCEQAITSQSDVRHALNLFTFDSATARYYLYVVQQPGKPAVAVAITIEGTRWIYGGEATAAGQQRFRTINDFSESDSYTWWTESSADGEHWTRLTGGRSVRAQNRK
jgi:hypothetical protein